VCGGHTVVLHACKLRLVATLLTSWRCTGHICDNIPFFRRLLAHALTRIHGNVSLYPTPPPKYHIQGVRVQDLRVELWRAGVGAATRAWGLKHAMKIFTRGEGCDEVKFPFVHLTDRNRPNLFNLHDAWRRLYRRPGSASRSARTELHARTVTCIWPCKPWPGMLGAIGCIA